MTVRNWNFQRIRVCRLPGGVRRAEGARHDGAAAIFARTARTLITPPARLGANSGGS